MACTGTQVARSQVTAAPLIAFNTVLYANPGYKLTALRILYMMLLAIAVISNFPIAATQRTPTIAHDRNPNVSCPSASTLTVYSAVGVRHDVAAPPEEGATP